MKRSHTVLGLILGGALALSGPLGFAKSDTPENASGTRSGSADTTQNRAAPSGSDSMASRKQVTHVVSREVNVTATVENIDQKNRKVTLKDADGDHVTVQVPEDVQGFDKLKKGQPIDITYREGVALTLLPAGSQAPAMQERVVGSEDFGNGVMAHEITTSATVVNVDTKKNKVTIRNAEGKTSTVNVENPDIQQRLKNVKPGDVVQMTYAESVATALKPHGQSSTQ
jgi:hypothetical protein